MQRRTKSRASVYGVTDEVAPTSEDANRSRINFLCHFTSDLCNLWAHEAVQVRLRPS
jgi:hypothetical protein